MWVAGWVGGGGGEWQGWVGGRGGWVGGWVAGVGGVGGWLLLKRQDAEVGRGHRERITPNGSVPVDRFRNSARRPSTRDWLGSLNDHTARSGPGSLEGIARSWLARGHRQGDFSASGAQSWGAMGGLSPFPTLTHTRVRASQFQKIAGQRQTHLRASRNCARNKLLLRPLSVRRTPASPGPLTHTLSVIVEGQSRPARGCLQLVAHP